MAQQDRKDREQRSAQTDTERGLQTTRGRGEMAMRDPLAAFLRDPFGSFWRDPLGSFLSDPFGLRESRRTGLTSGAQWIPQIETFQRGDQFIVRADLPGMRNEDISIELTDDAVIIQGERREEHEEDREGLYRTERIYGSFYRVIPLPEGAIPESAKATFNNGVLEISVQAPPREVSRRRRLEISGSSEGGRGKTEGQQQQQQQQQR